MDFKDIKLNENLINMALKDAIPSANMIFHDEKLPFKKVFITKHASTRFKERFGDGFTNIDIAKQIARSFNDGYYSLSSKDIPSFAIDVKFGEATAMVQMIKEWSKFNNKEEIYLVKTLYLKLNEAFIEKMEEIHDEKIKDDIFEKMIRDQFFKNTTEEEIFRKIRKPSEVIIKRVKKAIRKANNMIDPIKEMENNVSLFNDVEEKEQYKFGDGIKETPKEKDNIVYINKGEYDPLDDLLDESLFNVDNSDEKYKFGDGEERLLERTSEKSSKKSPLGLDLDSSDFPW